MFGIVVRLPGQLVAPASFAYRVATGAQSSDEVVVAISVLVAFAHDSQSSSCAPCWDSCCRISLFLPGVAGVALWGALFSLLILAPVRPQVSVCILTGAPGSSLGEWRSSGPLCFASGRPSPWSHRDPAVGHIYPRYCVYLSRAQPRGLVGHAVLH